MVNKTNKKQIRAPYPKNKHPLKPAYYSADAAHVPEDTTSILQLNVFFSNKYWTEPLRTRNAEGLEQSDHR